LGDYEGYAPCQDGITFAATDFAATCSMLAQGLLEDAPEARCDQEEYIGEVTFYCGAVR
jgi:hypothetical protein